MNFKKIPTNVLFNKNNYIKEVGTTTTPYWFNNDWVYDTLYFL